MFVNQGELEAPIKLRPQTVVLIELCRIFYLCPSKYCDSHQHKDSEISDRKIQVVHQENVHCSVSLQSKGHPKNCVLPILNLILTLKF